MTLSARFDAKHISCDFMDGTVQIVIGKIQLPVETLHTKVKIWKSWRKLVSEIVLCGN